MLGNQKISECNEKFILHTSVTSASWSAIVRLDQTVPLMRQISVFKLTLVFICSGLILMFKGASFGPDRICLPCP